MVVAMKKSKKKIKKTSIINKMLVSTFSFTIIPLIITGLLIIYAYQSLITDLLTKREIEVGEEVIRNLLVALQNAKIQAFLTLFIVIILTLFSNALISRGLTRPLKKLVKGTNEVAKGNLDFRIEIESRDELGELSEQFNKMTNQLKETKTALEAAKENLEKRVQERTEELKKITEALEESKAALEIKVKARTQELEQFTKSLEDQIKQRTKELQEKVKELEKFQKFTVGREMKIVELKEEIKRLKKELGKEKI